MTKSTILHLNNTQCCYLDALRITVSWAVI